MATLRYKWKLAAVSKERQELPRNSQSQNTSVPWVTEEYITQVFEKIESRVTKRLSQELSRLESRILGAVSKLEEFFLSPQIRILSGTVPGTFRNTDVKNQEPSGYHSQNDPYPELEFFACCTSNLIDPHPQEASHSYPVNWKAVIFILSYLKWSFHVRQDRKSNLSTNEAFRIWSCFSL